MLTRYNYISFEIKIVQQCVPLSMYASNSGHGYIASKFILLLDQLIAYLSHRNYNSVESVKAGQS